MFFFKNELILLFWPRFTNFFEVNFCNDRDVAQRWCWYLKESLGLHKHYGSTFELIRSDYRATRWQENLLLRWKLFLKKSRFCKNELILPFWPRFTSFFEVDFGNDLDVAHGWCWSLKTSLGLHKHYGITFKLIRGDYRPTRLQENALLRWKLFLKYWIFSNISCFYYFDHDLQTFLKWTFVTI